MTNSGLWQIKLAIPLRGLAMARRIYQDESYGNCIACENTGPSYRESGEEHKSIKWPWTPISKGCLALTIL